MIFSAENIRGIKLTFDDSLFLQRFVAWTEPWNESLDLSEIFDSKFKATFFIGIDFDILFVSPLELRLAKSASKWFVLTRSLKTFFFNEKVYVHSTIFTFNYFLTQRLLNKIKKNQLPCE